MQDEEAAWGVRVYTKGSFTDDLPAAAVGALVEHCATAREGDGFGMWTQGGAILRTPDDAAAFAGRSALFEMSSESDWTDPAEDDVHIGWARAAFEIVQPYAANARYVNDVTETGADMARSICGDARYERLRGVKRAWDPENVFRLNQNIAP
jgi:hypothetical protein